MPGADRANEGDEGDDGDVRAASSSERRTEVSAHDVDVPALAAPLLHDENVVRLERLREN
jgi:hypothetical protein